MGSIHEKNRGQKSRDTASSRHDTNTSSRKNTSYATQLALGWVNIQGYRTWNAVVATRSKATRPPIYPYMCRGLIKTKQKHNLSHTHNVHIGKPTFCLLGKK